MKLYVGTHHNPPDSLATVGIVMGTQALLHDFVLGPSFPSTHAFVVLDTEGVQWALDGKPSHAQWTACRLEAGAVQPVSQWEHGMTGPRPKHQALWRITSTGAERGAVYARSLDGAPYDWAEIAAQAGAAMSLLPGLHQFRMLGRADLLHEAFICTHVASRVLEVVGGAAAEAMRAMPDRYPERLAQVLRAAEGSWTERVR